MVSVSVFAFTGLLAAPVFAQVVVNCSMGLFIGKSAQCADMAKLVIDPDSSTHLVSGCLVTTSPPVAGKCVVNSGAVHPTKNVRVDFGKTFINIKNGAKLVRVDNFKMQYKTTVPAASKFTFSPTDIINTVTVRIGGTVNITTPGQGLGTYTGNLTIRANEL